MSFAVRGFALFTREVRTRMPFRYGIAELTRAPLLFARLAVDVDGTRMFGTACDLLAPKWFTKVPDRAIADEQAELIDVIRCAGEAAMSVGVAPSVFSLWLATYQRTHAHARRVGWPPLLASFGPTFVERALIDVACRARGTTFARAVREGDLGIELARVHSELEGRTPAELLPAEPVRSVHVRHTVGLTDPLRDEDIEAGHVADGLPRSLAASRAAYGLTHFKIKLSGDVARDLRRLREVRRLLAESNSDDVFTLDGNEQYRAVQELQDLWSALRSDHEIAEFLDRMMFLEQPLHRDAALAPDTLRALRAWEKRPRMIIDESDGELSSLPRALDGGYAGTSHKNCKGVFKSVANACLLAHRAQSQPETPGVLSAEDLTNVGPLPLLHDLAVVATLGISHVERNGHHYVRGLDPFPESVRARALAHHPDLFARRENGLTSLTIADGRLDLSSVISAPFGCGFDLDPTSFDAVTPWTFASA